MNCFHAWTRRYLSQVQLFVVGLMSFMLRLSKHYLMHVIVSIHQEITLNECWEIRQLLCQVITLKLEWNTASSYFLLTSNYHDEYLSIASIIFVNLHENSAIYFCNYCKSVYFGNPLRRSTNRFFQVALCFLLLILAVDSYFVLFMRICFSAQECAHLILLDLGSSEIRMFTIIVLITLQLALIVFFPIGNPFIIKDAG